MTGENGITRQTVRQTIVSDPQLAQELGAFFSADRSTRLQTKSLGTFNVDGTENGVLYGRLGSRDVRDRMSGNIDMVPGNTYTLDADGSIDKNGWWFGGDVSPTDQQDGRSGSRLQVAVLDREGNVIDRQNFRPGMQISTDQEGARLGFVFADGDLSDNSGHFNVNVRETSAVQQSTNVNIVASDADGIDRAGRTVVDALDSAPEAAFLPDPELSLSRPPADRGIAVDRSRSELETTDGYRFQFRDNEVRIDWPGRHNDGSAETRIRGRDVLEGDGTQWRADDGNYVLPNGAMFTLGYTDDGTINKFTLVQGDSRVDVAGIGDGDPQIGRVREGGLDYRRRAVEDNFGGSTYRMGGNNDGWSDLDVSWNLERAGQNVGRVQDDNWILRGAPYVVDPELKPQFGSADYERMLRAEIEDVRSAISGSAQAQGLERDVGRLIADNILGGNGTYDAYAERMQASASSREPNAYFQQLVEQMWLQQMLGGTPEYHGNFDNAMGSVQMLQRLLAAQAGMQNEFNAAAGPAQTFLPNYQQQAQIDPSMLIDQVLRGVGERTQQAPGRNRLDRFDINSDRRARGSFDNDPGAARLRSRLSEAESATGMRRLDQQASELSARIKGGDIDDSDMDRLAAMSTDDRVSMLSRLSSDDLKSLGNQLPGTDDEKAGSFLARLAEDAERHPEAVNNMFGSLLSGIKENGGNDSDDVLQYMQEKLGGGDAAASRLANLSDANLSTMADIHSGGNTDEEELEVIGRARGIATGATEDATALEGELARKVGDNDVDGELLNKLTASSPDDRLAALSAMSTEQRRELADQGADSEEEMGKLMASLVRDAQSGDPRAQVILRDFTTGIERNDDSDDVLQHMQRDLGGGDVDDANNQRRAARALAVLDPSILEGMRTIHSSGWSDDKELATLDLARQLRSS